MTIFNHKQIEKVVKEANQMQRNMLEHSLPIKLIKSHQNDKGYLCEVCTKLVETLKK